MGLAVTETIEATRQYLRPHRRAEARIGFVPTMGALHAGHHSLIERARSECDIVAVSIFVNPLQFGPNEDLHQYPRPRDADLAGCEARDVDLVFYPDEQEMYGGEPLTSINVAQMTAHLCGGQRPNHFPGVCTVVTKLFNILQPTRAYFGEKDFQQLAVVKRLVRDLSMPVEILGCPIVRDPDGLALSSRNAYLSETGRRQAAVIHTALAEAAGAVARGERLSATIEARVAEQIRTGGAESVDYTAVVDAESLELLERIDRHARLCAAAHFEGVRLIDNVALDAEPTAH